MKKQSLLHIVFILVSLVYVCVFTNKSDALSTVLKALPIFILLLGHIFSAKINLRIVFALIFSICGDVASELSLPSSLPFKLQISFFACAQFCYILEWSKFWKKRNKSEVSISIVPFLIGGYALLLIGNLLSSIIAERKDKFRFVSGVLIFILSDSLILVRMLSGGFTLDNELVMFTYYLAQYLLVTPYWEDCGKDSGKSRVN